MGTRCVYQIAAQAGGPINDQDRVKALGVTHSPSETRLLKGQGSRRVAADGAPWFWSAELMVLFPPSA